MTNIPYNSNNERDNSNIIWNVMNNNNMENNSMINSTHIFLIIKLLIIEIILWK